MYPPLQARDAGALCSNSSGVTSCARLSISVSRELPGAPVFSIREIGSTAVIGLTRVAAVELASKQIRVNAICPGSVNTPMAMEEGGESLLEVEAVATPLGRICEPGEVAALVHFLAARDCSYITGQAINLCGGLTAGLSENLWSELLENRA